jgi:fused signal recognition particle receptor
MKIFSGLKARKLARAIENQPDIFKHYQDLIRFHLSVGALSDAETVIRLARNKSWQASEHAWLDIQDLKILSKKTIPDDHALRSVISVYENTSLDAALRLEAALVAAPCLLTHNQDLLRNAASVFESIVALLPGNPLTIELMQILAEIESSAGRYAPAVRHIETALHIAVEHRYDNIAKLYLRAAELNKKTATNTGKTKTWLINALETGNLTDDETINTLAGIAFINRLEDDFLGAMERYETALRFAGNTRNRVVADIHFQLAGVYFSLGRIPQAEKEAVRAADTPSLPKNEQAEILLWLAGVKHISGQNTDALKILEQALVSAESVDVKVRLLQKQAAILETTGQYTDAINAIEKALTLNQSIPEQILQFHLARLHNLDGSQHKTLKILKQLSQNAAPGEPIGKDMILLETGRAYLGQQKIVKALETLIRILDEAQSDSAIVQQTRKQLYTLKKELRRPEGVKKYKLDGTDKKTIETLLGRIPDEEDFLTRLRSGLRKTHSSLIVGIEKILKGSSVIDDSVLDEIEELMILSDLGVETTGMIIQGLREKVVKKELDDAGIVRNHIRTEIERILSGHASQLETPVDTQPFIIMVVGVNGVGKTTTIAKIARRFQEDGRSVLLAAGDTFRAGAIEQLKEWGKRLEIDVVAHGEGADPSAVAWDAVAAAKNRKSDVLIIDTAGRLHTKSNLMEELKKVQRVIDKNMPGAPHEILLVLDATTGQNAIVQARQFCQTVSVSGIVLTKLDGTAKGGIIVSIVKELDIPIKLIGIGERMDDLKNFDPPLFARALFDDDDGGPAADGLEI